VSQCLADIWHLFLNNLDQQGCNFFEESVIHVVVPSANKDPVVRLDDEVVTDVINNYRFVQLAAQQRQIFYKEGSVLGGVLAIQTVLNAFTYVDLVNNLVRVLLQRCSENYDFIVLRHGFNKLNAAWSHHKETLRPILQFLEKNDLLQRCGLTSHLGQEQGSTFCPYQSSPRMAERLLEGL